MGTRADGIAQGSGASRLNCQVVPRGFAAPAITDAAEGIHFFLSDFGISRVLVGRSWGLRPRRVGVPRVLRDRGSFRYLSEEPTILTGEGPGGGFPLPHKPVNSPWVRSLTPHDRGMITSFGPSIRFRSSGSPFPRRVRNPAGVRWRIRISRPRRSRSPWTS